jgi:hypothetical protein
MESISLSGLLMIIVIKSGAVCAVEASAEIHCMLFGQNIWKVLLELITKL